LIVTINGNSVTINGNNHFDSPKGILVMTDDQRQEASSHQGFEKAPAKPNPSDKGKWVWEPIKKTTITERYVLMFQEALDVVSRDPDISGDSLRIWMQLLAKLEDKNWLHVQQSQIAVAMNMRTSHVSRAFKQLLVKGFLEEGPKVGRSKSYRISPRFAWKGYGEDYVTERHLRLVERMKSQGEHLRNLDK
jgi:hypothetical protein